MNIYIVRHAWAAERGDPQWPDDDLRPLTREGKKRFAQVAVTITDRGMTPEIIAASPLVRCVQTAEILAAALDKVEVVKLDPLRPGGSWDDLLHWTVEKACKHQEIAWVGHAPDVDRLAAALVGSGDGLIHFAKGAIAAIQFEGSPAFGNGELRWLATAKILGC